MLVLPLSILTLVIWLGLIFCHGRFWQAGPILRPVRGAQLAGQKCPEVCVVVPARDEAASVVRCVGSLLAQDYPGELHVIVLMTTAPMAPAGWRAPCRIRAGG